jgi:hypothetical protein
MRLGAIALTMYQDAMYQDAAYQDVWRIKIFDVSEFLVDSEDGLMKPKTPRKTNRAQNFLGLFWTFWAQANA